jgi:hypothetical protein
MNQYLKNNMVMEGLEIYGIIANVEYKNVKGRTFASFQICSEDACYNVIAPIDTIECDLDNCHIHICVLGIKLDNYVLALSVDRWGRYCDNCGKWHLEGYCIGDGMEYACSEECAIALYGGDKEALYADMPVDEDNNLTDDAVTYWTQYE